MGKSSNRSAEFFFTGKYDDDDGGNNIVAIGLGGEIYAKKGNDNITVGALETTIHAISGDKAVEGAAGYLKIVDIDSNLKVHGAAGYVSIDKSGNGNISFVGAAGGVSMDHRGSSGNLNFSGAAAYNNLSRKGQSGNVAFKGIGGYNGLWHETNQGDLNFNAAGAGNKIDRTWHDRYEGSKGNVIFVGGGAANSISSRVESGNITLTGAGVDNHIIRKGKEGNIIFQGAGASNRIERLRDSKDKYEQTRGNIDFEGAGGYNKVYSDIAHGNIRFSGSGGYNEISRIGEDSDSYNKALGYASAEEIVLITAKMGSQKPQQVTAIKSTTESNTYLFAFADGKYTKISKVQLKNDPKTNKLSYYATSWRKNGNQLKNLATENISLENGYDDISNDGDYRLSNLIFEHHQPVTIQHTVEEDLRENQWVTYASGTTAKAEDIKLIDAKMHGRSIHSNGSVLDVSAVKSNCRSNAYVYAKYVESYTKVVVVELKNDDKTGELKYYASAWYKAGDHTRDLANEDFSRANGYSPMEAGGYSLTNLKYQVDTVRRVSEHLEHIEEDSLQEWVKSSSNIGDSSGDVNFSGMGGGNVIKSSVINGNVNFEGDGIANVILHSSRSGNTHFKGAGAANIIEKSGIDGNLTFRGAGLANVLVHQSRNGEMDVYAGGAANVLVRVGDGLYLAHLLAIGNISIHQGNGDSRVIMFGGYNTHTQIGNGSANWLGVGGFNVMTQKGKESISSVLLGGANVLTKLGEDNLVSGMLGGANIITHISGDNKISDTTAIALGGANILTKVGNGDTTGIMLGIGNVLTHVGNGDRYNFAKGKANIITKVGGMREVTVVQGDVNIITHVGNGDDYTGAWGKANVITKVGDGNNVVLAKADANIVTQVGNGDSFNALWSKGNIVTKVGDGMQVTAAKGKANITTTVGNGLSVTATHGDLNVNTKVGDGVSVNAVWGEYNVNTKVGNGLNVAIMKGKGNANIHIGDGLGINASYARNNVAIKVGNGDFYSLSIAESNTQSSHLSSLFENIKQTVFNVEGSQAINYLIRGDEANTSGVNKGRGAINLTEVSAIDGFQMDKIDEVSSDLANNLSGAITPVETPDIKVIQNDLQIGDNVGSAQDQASPHADAVVRHAKQNKAAQNALSDKEKAEINHQRLQQEKDKQLKTISKSQGQLESTNQAALNTNGQVQRDAISEESRGVTEELFSLTQGMGALNNYGNYDGKSGDEWRNRFAGGYLDNIQNKLNDAKLTAQKKLADAQQHFIDKRETVITAIKKSEVGFTKSAENLDSADDDIADAEKKAEQRKEEALLQKQRADKAVSDANTAYDKAKQRGESDSTAAENKTTQAQKNAKSVKQADNAKPDRIGAAGSGLSGNAYTPIEVEKSKSHIDPASKAEPDGWLSEDLALTVEDLAALNNAQQAVNRLQLNKGMRSENTGASIMSMFTETSSDGAVKSTLNKSRELIRKAPTISGIDLQGLGGNNPRSRSSVLKKLELILLKKDDKRFIDSTKRRHIDLPNKALVAVREAFNRTVEQPDEQHVLQLEQALAHWQQHDPKEFAQRSKLVKSLRFEMGELVAHIQAQRAESARILGITVPPEQVAQFGQQVSFDGIGRVVGLKGDIAQSEINRLTDLQIKPLTQTNSVAEREAPKTENESLIVFVSRLQQEAIPAGKPLIERARKLWLTGQVTNEKTKELFKDAVAQLQTYPELHTLAQQLLTDANREKATGQYIDNLFGRHFDSELAYELVKTASPEAKNTAERTGNFLVEDFGRWIGELYPEGEKRNGAIDKKMKSFAEAIDKDFRPWFSRVPEVTTFLDDPTFANFKTMMTKVDDGFSVIKVPFLAVKMATTSGMGMDVADWKRKGDSFYLNVITKARSTSTELTAGTNAEDVKYKVEITEKQTNDYGTALPYQPANNKHDDFLYGRKVAAGRILTPGRETAFESNALERGQSVVTGASGSTNIMVHLNDYIASKQPDFSTGQSYLNTLSFLVFDGGHSVNESLVVYRALQATDEIKRKQILNSYTANYQDLADIAGESGKVWVNQALDNAFKETQEFYQKYAVVKPQSRPAVEDLEGLSGKNKGVEPTIIGDSHLKKSVDGWQKVDVTPQTDGRETRFDGQIILQMEDDPIAARAAANLAGKHPDSSVVIQLDANGKYRVVYGDLSKLSNKLRWQVVGHGRDTSEQNNIRLSGYSADELATKLNQFYQAAKLGKQAISKPDHISLVGCSLISDDKRDGFARRFITELDKQGIRSDVSARSSEVAVDATGRKFTRDENNQWVNNSPDNKIVLSLNAENKLITHTEQVRRGIAESDIDFAKVGYTQADSVTKGEIADNTEIFIKPQKREKVNTSDNSHRQLSYSGNIQVDVGEGEFTALNWGTSNVGIKVGTGGFKSLAFGDNNVMVHIGHGDSKHSVDIGGHQALEGAQMFIGNRNVSFNQGRSNDLIVMMDKSIPTPPLVNPFDDTARIAEVLKGIARSGETQDWLAAQDQQWTIAGARKFVRDMSGLDQTSSVDYKTLLDLDSQHERSSRGLQNDAESALNKKFNQWLGENGNSIEMGKMSRADKFRQANQKLAFNFAVGGRGADIQVTTGNWNFTFGDNIQSILDTNLGSLFGLMTQQYSATGMAKTTFTYTPQDLPRQLQNKLLGRLSEVGADTTLADIFGVDYTADGRIVSRTGKPVDGEVMLKEMLEVIKEFSGDQLATFTNPGKLLDSLEAGIKAGEDGVRTFAESHGLKEKAPDKNQEQGAVVSTNGDNAQANSKAERAFGFNSLNLPNLFATMFSKDKQAEMQSLVTNLKENLTADLLNMKQKTFDFLRNSGHLQGDGDINVSLGNYNFNWGGDGKDLGAYLGDNNNFWGGRGDDVYYSLGTSNIFTGGEGNDMGVLMGRENWMFGGNGDDTAVVAGRINHVFMGEGNDQTFVFGEGGLIDAGNGQDYVVTSGNYNRVDTGAGQDYAVTIGNNNRVDLGEGDDFARVFGNDNRIDGYSGNDTIKLMGYHAMINGGEGDDHLIAAAISKFSQFNGGDGQDLLVLGGYQNSFQGGAGVDSFVVSAEVIDNRVNDINAEDMILFNGVDWKDLWFQRSGYDLVLSVNRHTQDNTAQEIFESVGSVTFNDYFNGHRAKLVTQMGDKDKSGEYKFTALSDNVVDSLIQAMSSFSPTVGDNGFIESLGSKARAAVATAWADVTLGKGKFA
ncbi:MARTX multifunctional-autoprocessing repeats-in-toxin holotoxin RtxA [Photorhabdus sp. CRCIA-P01]|uniref:MARTX multifunctional-autoprocessing repeats-in-toxin holotoxin RtxA n=1 Tax=Photorhabdus sp. CRCIA-P01 TaxID=2019570 RepID=UPI000E59C1FC|nr:MARTX multifunctional-autoprocessing repeats-in-toxin holotoxin RtxA [Photorhabdus sp. CRCIA-P01]